MNKADASVFQGADIRKVTPSNGNRRPLDTSNESNRLDISTESNKGPARWPILSRNSQAIHRSTPVDEKARRSQVC